MAPVSAALVVLVVFAAWLTWRSLRAAESARISLAERDRDIAALRRLARVATLSIDAPESIGSSVTLGPEAATLHGLPPGSVPMPDFLASIKAADREAVRHALRRVGATLRPQSVSYTAGDIGPHRGIALLLSPDLTHAGTLATIRGALVEQSGQHEAGAALRRAERLAALVRLTGGLAHDFNNLLCAIALSLELLDEESGPLLDSLPPDRARAADAARELLGSARRSADRGIALTAQLVGVAGRPGPRIRIALADALADAAFRLDADLPGQTGLVREAAPDAPDVAADPTLLRAAILALAAAADADADETAGEHRISLTATRAAYGVSQAEEIGLTPGIYAQIVVRAGPVTLGEALPRADAAALHAPLLDGPGENLTARALAGALALVEGFARQMNGALLRGQDGLRLLLPAADHLGPATQAPDTNHIGWNESGRVSRPLTRLEQPVPRRPADGGMALGSLRILYVEDDDAVRQTAQAMLARDGATVTPAATGAEALAWLRGGERFDLVLSDVLLPGGMSGLDVVAEARSLRPGLPALLASGYVGADATASDGLPSLDRPHPPGVRLLRKPFRRTELLDAINATLTRPG